jgi:DNA-binding response OmpR family regulator
LITNQTVCSATRPSSQILGENLIKANSGSEALAWLLKTDIALILLDVKMSGQQGFELAGMIRDHPCFEHIGIIFISGVHLTDLDRLKGSEHGAIDYLTVPIIPGLLRAKVKAFAELHRTTRQLQILNTEMQKLSSGIIKLRDEERRRLARELHDGMGPELSVARLAVNSILATNQLSGAKEKAAEACEFI